MTNYEKKDPTVSSQTEMKLINRLTEQMAALCDSGDYSDVTFIVENERIPAHRNILAARCKYFKALLFGGLAETTQNEVKLQVPLEAFKTLLAYIYSGRVSLAQLSHDDFIDMLGLAHQYELPELILAVSEYLIPCLSVDNIFDILEAARLYNIEKLIEACSFFVDQNAKAILKHVSFKRLSQETLEEILERDTFFARELDIFLAVKDWSAYNIKANIETLVALVRLPLMDQTQLLEVVRPTGLVAADKLLDAIEEQRRPMHLRYRAAFWPEENIASSKFALRVIIGGTCAAHNTFVVQLNGIYHINHLKMFLWPNGPRFYSYYAEVSIDQNHWERVIDYSQYHCRSWQTLFFKSRPVKYIKLVALPTAVYCHSFQAMHTAKVPELVNGIIVPKNNVATENMGAEVMEGSGAKNAMVDGNHTHYDSRTGFTFHTIRDGGILVALNRPFILNSMRLLLWDRDDRTYSFYVETSVDLEQWDMAVDKRNERLASWQNFKFVARPVVYIRIVGTYDTYNEGFRCVHLECPSQDLKFLQDEEAEHCQEE